MIGDTMVIMGNEMEDYYMCDASENKERLRKLKALMDSSCYIYHLLEEEMKLVQNIRCFDISKMIKLCTDVERHILGYIGNPCVNISGYADYIWEKRSLYKSNLNWSLDMKKLYIIKNVIATDRGHIPAHPKQSSLSPSTNAFVKKVLRMINKSIDIVMTPIKYYGCGTSSAPHILYSINHKYRSLNAVLDMDNDYRRIEWLNNKWKENPQKIERLASAEIKRLKKEYGGTIETDSSVFIILHN